MILNEPNDEPSSAPSTGDEWLFAPGPVWYTPHRGSVCNSRKPLPARLVRSLGGSAWIALWLPNGRWKRLQPSIARLRPRMEEMELDRAWAAAHGSNGGAATKGTPE